jgi:hypothetical protein
VHKTSLSYNATATSYTRSGSQLNLVQALAMAQELLRYQPTDVVMMVGWLELSCSSPSPEKILHKVLSRA